MLYNLYATATYTSSTITNKYSGCLSVLVMVFTLNKSFRTRDNLHLPYILMIVLNLIKVTYSANRTIKPGEYCLSIQRKTSTRKLVFHLVKMLSHVKAKSINIH